MFWQKKHKTLLALALIVPALINGCVASKKEGRPTFHLKLYSVDSQKLSTKPYANLHIEWLPDETEPKCVTPAQGKLNPQPVLSCQFCLTRAADGTTHTAFISPDKIKKRSCAVVIPQVAVNFQSNGVTNLTASRYSQMHFSLDEHLADRVDAALRKNSHEYRHEFWADVSFDDKLKPFPRELYIDGMPHKTFIEGR